MACDNPVPAVQSRPGARLSFGGDARGGRPLFISCGNCLSCRLQRSNEVAMRIMHESAFHSRSSFVTLTYRDDAVPQYGSLRYRDVQLFLKRLRKDYPVRFVCCGEYGPKTLRPHYHLCIFGYFPDDHSWCGGSENERLYSSKSLDKYWGLGETRTGELTFQSAAYVARYVVGKVTGEKAVEHYQRVTLDGEIVSVDPEFMQMSRGGRGGRGIGFEWYKRYCASSRGIAEDGPLGRGVVVVDGRERKQPKYYDKLLKEFNAEALDRISKQRLLRVTDESVSERHIRARAVIARARMSLGRSRGDW